ncbi:precorrin-4 C(11)-methyltransferase [Odoribacteraceae bacterium]|nr:precorrin-4 C(11)-methyltransferase [Odoribacteraceae bacterium]GKH95610.1 precorrin-4 C(11)-methyltransferase [Odoribacteraceae bacterium]GKH98234.1 precorrin-4 C(11)-methyltransferase [Odoribacteraceae bacterium]GKI00972.1 precorrin-4 C(11)-methyltransferase [Odoribacteraceae bacterium]
MKKIAIIIASHQGLAQALTIHRELPETELFYAGEGQENPCTSINSIPAFVATNFTCYEGLVFIGALGICVRSIAPCIHSKYTDPAVVNIDSTGKHVISVLSGHVGGANELTRRLASILGAAPVITTQSDNNDLWALDTIHERFGGWIPEPVGPMNEIIYKFVNRRPVALLLDIQDSGTRNLERTAPPHVDIYNSFQEIDQNRYEALIIVSPFIYPVVIPTLYYRPHVLSLGFGCRENCDPSGIREYITARLIEAGISPTSLTNLATIDIKKDEPVVDLLTHSLILSMDSYSPDELRDITVPNPSEKVREVTSSPSVAEAAALKSTGNTRLLLEKQKGKLSEGNDFTFAVAMNRTVERRGFIEIVGAGPGDPELISVKGKHFLEQADLILYAGSLVPVELTYYAKPGATVRSSADMTLEEQFALMKEFYDRGLFIVRLHTGDPCIYGAIQEQMAFFDEYGMDYHITPGISSFLAAAAALQSQFTIPEKVQTIILTRGEGRTPMPEKEKLHLLARSQSTMCIFLSASIVDQVQSELMQHYPPTTPVAACYHLTWKDERIYRGELQDLAKIVKENNLTLTTMIVVGDAIDNRQGLSKLYSHQFKHLFRN